MHVGTAVIFQNPGRARADFDVYQDDLALADLAEPLGYESIWTVEHHFTDYTMSPNPMQFLTWMAGRTETIKLGTMVVVLPWHNPVRVAEEISVLDTMSKGRVILGIGRGAGKIEFDGFHLDMQESRARFVEGAEAVIEALEQGWIEYYGKFVNQRKRNIRPEPYKSFKGRTYAAAVSPESAELMAELGVGILIIPQKPWDAVEQELANYAGIFKEVQGTPPPPTVHAGWTFVDEDEERAYEKARQYIGGYWTTVLEHYEFAKGHLKKTKGYEYYGKFADQLEKVGDEGAIDFFLNLQIWGTPEQCYEKIVGVSNRIWSDTFVGVFSYAGMPHDEARRNMELFAKEVAPELRKLPTYADRQKAAAE